MPNKLPSAFKIFFFASSDFCQLLITFANKKFGPGDQNVCPDLDPNCLIASVPERIFGKEVSGRHNFKA